jgi:hypothetical protein
MSEEPATNNKIQRMMEFKKEGLTGCKNSEFVAPVRLPEVDLIYPGNSGEKSEPIAVSNPNKTSQLNLLALKHVPNNIPSFGCCYFM